MHRPFCVYNLLMDKNSHWSGANRKGKEKNFILVSSCSSAGALIGDTVN